MVRQIFVFFLVLNFIPAFLSHAEEGMYPLSQLNKLDLKAAGFEISAKDIFNESGTSLADAIVNLSGCTASFVSANGLMLTNHHCAFRAVQAASTEEHDYVRDGFSARSAGDEIPARGYTVRITESYSDVSEEVLSAVENISDPAARFKAIDRRIKEIVSRAEQANPGKRAEVATMFSGQSYVLFIYTYIKDVRIVYVPPRSVGEFGGDIDNWEWPRHNADFSFLRAYVAPDGSPAAFSPDNVPYHPKKYLQVDARGVKENDLVFILGYPGRTYRHRTSHFLSYEQEIRMPFVVDWYQWQMALMEKMSSRSPEIALKHSGRIKGLANTEKNYRGKLKALKKLDHLSKVRKQESDIQDFMRKDNRLNEKYATVLGEIGAVYAQRRNRAIPQFILNYMNRSVTLMQVANTLFRAARERQKDDLERESAFMDRNFERTKERTLLNLKNFYAPTDKAILKALLEKADKLPDSKRIKSLDKIFNLSAGANLDSVLNEAFNRTILNDADRVQQLFELSLTELVKIDDPVLQWRAALEDDLLALKAQSEQESGALTRLLALWGEIKQAYLKSEFVPDANGTFRMTYGRIEGYSPADAVYKYPFTTVSGVVEKTTGQIPFNTPQKLLDLYRQGDFGMLKSRELNDLPVCILYSTDTTGGNSGSPVLNARGRLIGLNFDRTFEATINDFAWDHGYSRSIGVDIRYILWLLHKFTGTDYLLDEMNVNIRN